MLIRNFTPGLSSPGTIATGSSHRPYIGDYGYDDIGSPMLVLGSDLRNNVDYGENRDYPDTDYGRAFTHFYGFKELSPQGETNIGSNIISASISGDMRLGWYLDIDAAVCHTAKECGEDIVFQPGTCSYGDLSAIGHANRPYVYAPPLSPLSHATWAGGVETGSIQNLELAQGGFFVWAQYYEAEPGSGPGSGQSFIDNSQEHPMLLVDGIWKYGSAAEAIIAAAMVYDPDSFEFSAPGSQDLTPGHSWVDDFDQATVVTEDANDLMFWLRPWTDIAHLTTGYAQLVQAPPITDDYDADEMDTSFYQIDTVTSVVGAGSFTAAEAHTRGLAYTRYRLYPTYDGDNPLIAPWGDVEEKDAMADPPGYTVQEDEVGFGCRSITEDLDELDPATDIEVCNEDIVPYLGYALYLRLDETLTSFSAKFGFAKTDVFSGTLAWANMVGAMHEYVYEEWEWYKTLTCLPTEFATQTGGGTSGPHEYLFDNDPAADFTDSFSCNQEGYRVTWPTIAEPGPLPPPAWGCQDDYSLDGGVCDWPATVGGTNVKIITEEDSLTWDFVEYEPLDQMKTQAEYIASQACVASDTLAWYYCPCRCPVCGDFFTSVLEYYTDLFDPSGPAGGPCGDPDFIKEGYLGTTFDVEQQQLPLSSVAVTPGWWRFEIDVDPSQSPLLLLLLGWDDRNVAASSSCLGDLDGVYAIGDVRLVLENTDTQKEGEIILGYEAAIGSEILKTIEIGVPVDGADPETQWFHPDKPKIAAKYACVDGALESDYGDLCGYGAFASLWQTTVLTQYDLNYEDPHESPISDFEPNGDTWITKRLQVNESSFSVSCGWSGDMFDNICFHYHNPPYSTFDACDTDDTMIGFSCTEVDEYCQPAVSEEAVDSFGPSALGYSLITFFRAFN